MGLSIDDEVVFIKENLGLGKGEEFSGSVLGVEAEYFWVVIPELQTIYVGHPDQIFTYQDRQIFSSYDHAVSFKKISEAGDNAYIFQYASCKKLRDKMISQVKAHIFFAGQ